MRLNKFESGLLNFFNSFSLFLQLALIILGILALKNIGGFVVVQSFVICAFLVLMIAIFNEYTLFFTFTTKKKTNDLQKTLFAFHLIALVMLGVFVANDPPWNRLSRSF